MANPNIVNVSSIFGKIVGQAVTTSTSAVVTNPASSNKIFKINSLIVTNVDGSTNCDVTIDVFKNQTTSLKIASTVVVPADASLVVISKETALYLEENDSIRCLASANGDLEVLCSYEEIS